MLERSLRLAALAGLAAISAPIAALDIDIVNRTAIAVPAFTGGDSSVPGGISDDGRYALFVSTASNLVAGDTNRASDLFLYDHTSGTIERVSVGSGAAQATGDTASLADLSADARYVVFESRATGLAATDTHDASQIYLRDRTSQTTTLISHGLDGSGSAVGSYAPQISADGRYVVFASYDRLVDDDQNVSSDIYRYDRDTGSLQLVSVSPSGANGAGPSLDPHISADGRYVAFRSGAPNLIPGDTNGDDDIVLRDLVTSINVNASVTPDGSQFVGPRTLAAGNAISADGRYVLFNTDSALESADTNGQIDGFRFDRTSSTSLRVTRDASGGPLFFGASARALSADGDVLVMEYIGNDLAAGTTVGYRRSYSRRISDGAIAHVKLRPGGVIPSDETLDCALSGDATVAYCRSDDRNLTDIDDTVFSDVFRSEIGADGGTRISRPLPAQVAASNGYSGGLTAGASADGRYVAFQSRATNLVVDDHNGVEDIFLRDRLAGTTQRISHTASGAERNCPSAEPRITPDGRYVVFISCAGLDWPSAPETIQIYRYDRITDSVALVSTNFDGLACNAHCRDGSISDDGQIVAFASSATNLGPGTSSGSVFARRLPGGAPVLASRPPGGGLANGFAHSPQISGDGRFVYFASSSTNLVATDTNAADDVFAYEYETGTLRRTSVGPGEQQLVGASRFYGVSRDGTRFLFRHSGFLCNGDGLHVRDTVSGQSECVSRDGITSENYGVGYSAVLSDDSNRVAFTSFRFPPSASTPVEAVMVHDRITHRVRLTTPAAMNRSARILDVCAGADCLLFSSTANNVVPDDPNNHVEDVFIALGLQDAIFEDGFAVP